jgi:hypothetical protein|mmetsp:Transcript_9499/g.17246  ORF Transcript_9499/g.17246 Transcript_9499/m.17246 type:complete len:107 (-) Transcript_9499:1853-2173(-)
MMTRQCLVVPLVVLASLLISTDAFVARSPLAIRTITTSNTASFLAKKKQNVDFSDIETRDMTKAEMLELNSQNEDIMNMELQMMTVFSLVISLPILYLCWVAFFSE